MLGEQVLTTMFFVVKVEGLIIKLWVKYLKREGEGGWNINGWGEG
jgi:hypothetical protein